jgi:hypothetical protein
VVQSLAALFKLVQIVPTQNKSVQLGVMDKDRVQIAGAANVKLKAVGAVVQGKIESGESIFWRVMARAAMSQQEELIGQANCLRKELYYGRGQSDRRLEKEEKLVSYSREKHRAKSASRRG